jgi:hypothetical protein
MGCVEFPPAQIVARFGPPRAGDGYKISGEYVFADAEGRVFALHDWKSTSLWEAGLPTPDEFWASPAPAELSLSSRDLPTADFEAWLHTELARVGVGS